MENADTNPLILAHTTIEFLFRFNYILVRSLEISESFRKHGLRGVGPVDCIGISTNQCTSRCDPSLPAPRHNIKSAWRLPGRKSLSCRRAVGSEVGNHRMRVSPPEENARRYSGYARRTCLPSLPLDWLPDIRQFVRLPGVGTSPAYTIKQIGAIIDGFRKQPIRRLSVWLMRLRIFVLESNGQAPILFWRLDF